jgi:hypothetical protein
MNFKKQLPLAALLVAGALAAPRAQAQCAAGYGLGGYGGYWDIGRLYSVLADNVPYYAAFPPVYYSVPVPRTYGYSPFAYPPGVMTPDVECSQPATINNPYYSDEVEQPAAEAEAAPADETTSLTVPAAPLVINNPFVTGAKLAAAR